MKKNQLRRFLMLLALLAVFSTAFLLGACSDSDSSSTEDEPEAANRDNLAKNEGVAGNDTENDDSSSTDEEVVVNPTVQSGETLFFIENGGGSLYRADDTGVTSTDSIVGAGIISSISFSSSTLYYIDKSNGVVCGAIVNNGGVLKVETPDCDGIDDPSLSEGGHVSSGQFVGTGGGDSLYYHAVSNQTDAFVRRTKIFPVPTTVLVYQNQVIDPGTGSSTALSGIQLKSIGLVIYNDTVASNFLHTPLIVSINDNSGSGDRLYTADNTDGQATSNAYWELRYSGSPGYDADQIQSFKPVLTGTDHVKCFTLDLDDDRLSRIDVYGDHAVEALNASDLAMALNVNSVDIHAFYIKQNFNANEDEVKLYLSISTDTGVNAIYRLAVDQQSGIIDMNSLTLVITGLDVAPGQLAVVE